MTEMFIKSNRVTAMWALPFGAALALFAPDLVRWVLGEKWAPATILIQAIGITSAVHQLGFNWTAFYRAVGISKPQAWYALAALAAFVAVPVPLLFTVGVDGFAYGMFAVMAAAFGVRTWYVKRLLPGVPMTALVARCAAPVLLASAAVLAARALEDGVRTPAVALAELALFAIVLILCTWLAERPLIGELAGYLRRGGRLGAAGGEAPA